MDLLAQTDSGGSSALMFYWWIWLASYVFFVIGGWKMFEKAGQEGWKVLIPFYNYYIVLKIVGRPGWWLILYFIPIVGFVVWIIVAIDLSKSFGHGVGFGLGVAFLSFIFILILGFGSDQYVGPSAPGAAPMAPPAAPPAPPPPPM